MTKKNEKLVYSDPEHGWEVVEIDGKEFTRRSIGYQQALIEKKLKKAKIPRRYGDLTLEDFNDYNAVLKAAKRAITDFRNVYPSVETGLLLVGPPGTGKTHLASALLQALIKKSAATGLFVDYREFIRSIQDSFNPATLTTSRELIQPVLEAEVLLMDELGALTPTEWVTDTITYIINNRYTNEKITIFTTNFAIEKADLEQMRLSKADVYQKELQELKKTVLHPEEYKIAHRKLMQRHGKAAEMDYTLQDKIGSRLMSRIHEMCQIIPFDGAVDYRIHKKSIPHK